MKTLKTILLSNASKYIHLVVIASLLLFASRSPFLYILSLIYLLYIYRKSKSLALIAALLLLLLGSRLYRLNGLEPELLPLKAKIEDVQDKYLLVKAKQKYIVYYNELEVLEPGMTILIEGSYTQIDEMHIEHSFNYNSYLKSKAIYHLISANKIVVVGQNINLKSIPYYIKNKIEQNFDKEISAYVKLFILGENESLDDTVMLESRNIGIAHLFAISGMHLGLVLLVVNKGLHLFYLKRTTHNILLMLFLVAYNIITGFSISIVRASLFTMVLLASKESKHRFTKTDYLSFICLFMLLYNPFIIYNTGFQLSFLITFIILLMQHSLQRTNGVKQLLIISFYAVAFSLPITLSLNKTIGIFNIVYSPLFIIFVSYFLLPGAFILLLLPGLNNLYKLCIDNFESLISLANKGNMYFVFNFNHSILVIIYWILLVYTITHFKKHKKIKVLAYWMIYVTSITIFSTSNLLTKVVIFDVNQADASYIQSNKCRLLIDTGNTDDYNALLHYFQGENISHIHGIVLTHQHIDHYGEVNDLLKQIKVDYIFVSKIYEDVQLDKQIILVEGDHLKCGNLDFQILNANRNDRNENNNSLVLYGEIGGDNWLFTGDIEKEVEKRLVEKYQLQVDHLKVAHHGSDTSSTKEFIDKIKAREVYISSGYNHYGIPSKDVLDRFDNYGTRIYATQDRGSIVNIYYKKIHFKYFYYNQQRIYE